MPSAHSIQSLGLNVQLLTMLRLRQSSTAPVHAFIAYVAAPVRIARACIKLRAMAHEILDPSDPTALG
jgi:hypothetical protein